VLEVCVVTRNRIGLLAVVSFASALAACGGGGNVAPTAPAPLPSATPTPAATARYSVTFNATWSMTSHPQDFPRNPHFSPLVGGTHSERVSFWAPGGIASDAIEAMAERGASDPLAGQVEAAIAAGTAQRVLRGGAIDVSPGAVSLEFEIGRDLPLVTLVSMLAPSPDWFTGVHDLSLIEGGDWVREKVVTLHTYDAGTDSGASYSSPDLDSQPREPISRIDGAPLAMNGSVAPVGSFTFRRLQ
jgi:hypothetical protein